MKVTVEVSFVDDRPGSHATICDIAKDFKEQVTEALKRLDSDSVGQLLIDRNTECPWRDMDINVVVDEISATTRNKEVLQ